AGADDHPKRAFRNGARTPTPSENGRSAPPKVACSLHHVDSTEHVGFDILAPVGRILVGGGRVHDVGGTKMFERAPYQVAVGDRALDQLEPRKRRHQLAPTGREIVDDEDVVPKRVAMLGKVRTETSGSAGYQNPHWLAQSRAMGRWVCPPTTPRACQSSTASAAMRSSGVNEISPKSANVRAGSSRIDGASSGLSLRTSGSG